MVNEGMADEGKEREEGRSTSEGGGGVLQLRGLPSPGAQFTATSGFAFRKVWQAEQPITTNEGEV